MTKSAVLITADRTACFASVEDAVIAGHNLDDMTEIELSGSRPIDDLHTAFLATDSKGQQVLSGDADHVSQWLKGRQWCNVRCLAVAA